MTRTIVRRVPIPCPVKDCGQPLSEVVDTWPYQHAVKRRRQCVNGHRATTREVVDSLFPLDTQDVGVEVG